MPVRIHQRQRLSAPPGWYGLVLSASFMDKAHLPLGFQTISLQQSYLQLRMFASFGAGETGSVQAGDTERKACCALRSPRPRRPIACSMLRRVGTGARKTSAILRQGCKGKCQVNHGQRPRGDDLSLLQELALGECRACWNRHRAGQELGFLIGAYRR